MQRIGNMTKLALKDRHATKGAAVLAQQELGDISVYARWGGFGLQKLMERMKAESTTGELTAESTEGVESIRQRLIEGDWADFFFGGSYMLRDPSFKIEDYPFWNMGGSKGSGSSNVNSNLTNELEKMNALNATQRETQWTCDLLGLQQDVSSVLGFSAPKKKDENNKKI